MDKFSGIKRANVILTTYEYEILPSQRQTSSKPIDKKSSNRIFTALRYGLCLVIIAICLLGKFTQVQPLQEAFSFIKEQLQRDYISELIDEYED